MDTPVLSALNKYRLLDYIWKYHWLGLEKTKKEPVVQCLYIGRPANKPLDIKFNDFEMIDDYWT